VAQATVVAAAVGQQQWARKTTVGTQRCVSETNDKILNTPLSRRSVRVYNGAMNLKSKSAPVRPPVIRGAVIRSVFPEARQPSSWTNWVCAGTTANAR
jgi:hypothetical protein